MNIIYSEPSKDSQAVKFESPATQPRTAWDPYRLLAPTTRRRIDPTNVLPQNTSYLHSLSISNNVASERLDGKYLQLEPPKGKMTERRKIELEKKAMLKDAKKLKRIKEGACGLIGRRMRNSSSKKELETTVRYEAVLPIHSLWLGYMSELLSLSLVIPSIEPVTPSLPSTSTLTTSTLIPTFPAKNYKDNNDLGLARDLNINVVNIHSKLVKAEFVGCIITVKRAKNPSLVSLQGLVLQETQGTFKIVTTLSKIKVLPKQGSIFTFSLPLTVPPSTSTTSTTTSTSDSNVIKRDLSLDIFGDSFCYRSSERVGRKWKAGSGGGGVELM